MLKKIILWVITVSLMVTIFAFSSQEATESDKVSSSFIVAMVRFFDADNSLSPTEITTIAEDLTFIVRKCAHFSIYALLGFSAALLISQYGVHGRLQLLFSVFAVFIYACSDEFHQTFVKGRSGELRDVVIDTLGALCGALLALAFAAIFKKIHKRRIANGLFKEV